MSAKMQFLKKLHTQSPSRAFSSKSEADIADFHRATEQLQENMAEWLADTGIYPESSIVSLTDLLVEDGTFDAPEIMLRHEKRLITFTPIFLYGDGVTGCIEVSLYIDGKVTQLSRLFMRAGKNTDWTCTQIGTLSKPERVFDEDVFFGMIEGLLS